MAGKMANIEMLENFLDYCAVKNRVISKNIANITTENYKAEDVNFDDILNKNMNSLLKTTNQKHMTIGIDQAAGPQVVHSSSDSDIYDKQMGNNVDIEKEMAELARNTLNYKFATKKIGSYYRTLQSVIRGGSQ